MKRMCVLLAVTAGIACGPPNVVPVAPLLANVHSSQPEETCAGITVYEPTAPKTQDYHRAANFWIEATTLDPDQKMMSPQQIEATNAKYGSNTELFRDPLQSATSNDAEIRERWKHREVWMSQKLSDGSYVEHEPGAMGRAMERIQRARLRAEFHVITEESALWCVPTVDGILSQARDVAFDRNRCTGLHPGELVLATHVVEGEPWVHVEAGHSSGWLIDPRWTPPLSRDEAERFATTQPRGYVTRETSSDNDQASFRLGTSFPLSRTVADAVTVVTPTSTGLREQTLDRGTFSDGPLPLTRRRVLELAFSQIRDPYGWGGYQGNRDCSRFLHDVLATFGILMARNSAAQSVMGAANVSLEGMTDAEKRSTLDRLNANNLVLLYMPGHIMLYLGRDGDRRFALSSLSEYLRPCEGGGAQTVRLDRVEVTQLELGRGTSRTSFIERLTTAIIFGPG